MVLKVPVKELPPEEAAKTQVEDEVATSAGQPAMKASAKELFKGPVDKKRVALTFDAGEASEATPRILEALKVAKVKGTFFLTGKWIEENAELTKKIVSEGHSAGNHSYSHVDFTKQTDNEIVYQLSKADELLMSLTKTSMKPIFRPPFGARDGRVLRVAARAGYTSIYWTVDSLDWKQGMKPEQVKNRALAGLTNGAIVLMHCGSSQTAEILPGLIKDIESRGYELVTVPELFEQ
ncbi:MAG: polysaccharide deacetylase family protein [Candidatus Aquicultor sp.]|nr:polysaccharide deacetylase family protein [Candidatus Aquicultor sp.]